MGDMLVGQSAPGVLGNSSKSKAKNVEGKKELDLFGQAADKQDSSLLKGESKTDKPEGIVRRLFDAAFSRCEARGNTCISRYQD